MVKNNRTNLPYEAGQPQNIALAGVHTEMPAEEGFWSEFEDSYIQILSGICPETEELSLAKILLYT